MFEPYETSNNLQYYHSIVLQIFDHIVMTKRSWWESERRQRNHRWVATHLWSVFHLEKDRRKPGSFRFEGFKVSRPSSSAFWQTGEGTSLRPRPAGLSGPVTTPTKS